MTRKQFAVIMIVAMLCCVAYAITLQATGQHAEAADFVKWAGGGLCTIFVLVLFFGG